MAVKKLLPSINLQLKKKVWGKKLTQAEFKFVLAVWHSLGDMELNHHTIWTVL